MEYIIIIKIVVNGLLQNKVFYTITREEAEKVASKTLDRFLSINGITIHSAKIYKAEQIGFVNQI